MNHDTSLPVPLSDDDYELPTASSFIESLFEQFDPAIDEVGESMTYLNVLSVDLPIEMALREVDGTTVVAMSPPTQRTETSVYPVLHQIRMTLKSNQS